MKDRAELKEAVKTRAALESYQDSVYLRLMKQLNSNCQEIFADNLGSEFINNCGRDIASEVVRNCFQTSSYYITVDQLAERILKFTYENEYDPLAQNGGVGDIAKSVYNYNELKSAELDRIAEELDVAQKPLFTEERSSSSEKKREEAGKEKYKASVVEDVEETADGRKGILKDDFTGEETETTYENGRWKSHDLQVDHVQSRASARYNSKYVTDKGVRELQDFWNSNDNFELMLNVANNAKNDVRVCEVTKDGKTVIMYLTSKDIMRVKHDGADDVKDITHKATPEQMTEAVIKKLEEVNTEKEGQSQKKIEALKEKGYLDENGKVPKSIRNELVKRYRRSMNSESVITLKNTKYGEVASQAAKATLSPKGAIGKIIAGQIVYYAAPPLIYELRLILKDKAIKLDNAIDRLATSAKRIGEYLLSKIKDIFKNVLYNSLKNFVKTFMDILIGMVKATIKKILKLAKNLVLSTVDAVRIISDPNTTRAQKADSVTTLFGVVITNCVVEVLFEMAGNALHIPEPFDDIVFGPLQILTTIICTNLTILILKKADLFDVQYGFKMTQIRQLFAETEKEYQELCNDANKFADERIDAIIELARVECREIYDNLEEINIHNDSARESLEKINGMFSMNIDFEERWLAFIGIT